MITAFILCECSAIKHSFVSCNTKTVECVELGIIFESVTDAARYVGINISAISRVCLKKRKRAHGMHFNFV